MSWWSNRPSLPPTPTTANYYAHEPTYEQQLPEYGVDTRDLSMLQLVVRLAIIANLDEADRFGPKSRRAALENVPTIDSSADVGGLPMQRTGFCVPLGDPLAHLPRSSKQLYALKTVDTMLEQSGAPICDLGRGRCKQNLPLLSLRSEGSIDEDIVAVREDRFLCTLEVPYDMVTAQEPVTASDFKVLYSIRLVPVSQKASLQGHRRPSVAKSRTDAHLLNSISASEYDSPAPSTLEPSHRDLQRISWNGASLASKATTSASSKVAC